MSLMLTFFRFLTWEILMTPLSTLVRTP
jgi:hypothetical protein